MKYFVVILFLTFAYSGFSQELNNDTIQLKEVRLKNYKPKIKNHKVNGSGTTYEHLNVYDEIVTLVDDLPKGFLHSVIFNFNNDITINGKPFDFQDTEIEVVFYKVTSDKRPGNKISGKTIVVSKEYSGKMEVDVSDLNVQTNGELFIGIRRITEKKTLYGEFEVHGIGLGDDKYVAYCRSNGSDVWKGSNDVSRKITTITPGLKMKIKIEVQ